MNKRLGPKIDQVRNGINNQLAREYSGLGRYGQALQREGWEGGYLQALSDVAAYLHGYADLNSRHHDLWVVRNKRKKLAAAPSQPEDAA